jgi:hypothetical protein
MHHPHSAAAATFWWSTCRPPSAKLPLFNPAGNSPPTSTDDAGQVHGAIGCLLPAIGKPNLGHHIGLVVFCTACTSCTSCMPGFQTVRKCTPWPVGSDLHCAARTRSDIWWFANPDDRPDNKPLGRPAMHHARSTPEEPAYHRPLSRVALVKHCVIISPRQPLSNRNSTASMAEDSPKSTSVFMS